MGGTIGLQFSCCVSVRADSLNKCQCQMKHGGSPAKMAAASLHRGRRGTRLRGSLLLSKNRQLAFLNEGHERHAYLPQNPCKRTRGDILHVSSRACLSMQIVLA